MSVAPPVTRLLAIDVLRGLAAGYVVLFHTALVPSPAFELPGLWMPFVRFGGTGVLLFFVLSGFSLSMTMPRHLAARSPLLSYARSRVWRIAPVFYVLLLACVLQDFIRGESFWPGRIVLNASFLFNLVRGQQEGMVMASWTIGVEVLYYLAFPFLYRLQNLQKVGVAILALTGLGVMSLSEVLRPMAYFSVVGFVPVFLVGELSFALYRRLSARSDRLLMGQLCLTGGCLVLLGCMAVPGAEKMLVLRVPIAFGYGLVVVGMVMRPVGVPGWGMRAFAGLGLISYPLYLGHAPIIVAFDGILQSFRAGLPEGLAYGAGAGVVLVVAISLAVLLHWAVEEPGRLLGGRVFAFRVLRRV